MKIALVHDFLLKLGGAERVLKVLSEMYPDAPIYTLLYDEKVCGEMFPAERVRTSFLQKYPSMVRKFHRLFTHQMPRAMEEMDFSEYDLVISSSSAFAHGLLVPSNTKHVCYCHSPMRYAWDHSAEYLLENNITGLKKGLYAWLIRNLREWDQVAAGRPDLYIANSAHVAKRLKKYYRAESEVIYPPVDVDRFKVGPKDSDYFLIVSTLTPYKKIDLAVQLFNKIGHRLVIIGEGPHKKYLEAIAADNIDFLGFKKDEEVQEYMQNCRALLFPGEEDFGIVPVEAMACGKPVLAYGKGGLLETVIPGETGEFFYEDSVGSFEDGLARLIHNEKNYSPTKIRKHSLQFGRENFEKSLKKVCLC
ncbi:glycosyltransferase [Candidatus Peregrinibacteria bacterium]|jgi:glycosyltransferase involved in cell wall biosynthesis|nr:glycosyltransferase [Candidatus Peregrinibacteria bacterium]MBT4055628.1 glycosyltransferase [Candidatus Peregrinibacteria bacterium]